MVNRLDVSSLHISVPLTPEECSAFSGSRMPEAHKALLADCGSKGFTGVVGARAGPLQPLSSVESAPAGTEVVIWDSSGVRRTWKLDATVLTLSQNPDGSWPGHGARPGQLFIQVRGSGQGVQRFGPA